MKRLASRAVIVYDADASGQAAMERAMALFEESDLPVRVVVLPGGDPDEFLRTRGVETFRGLIAGALPVFEYQLRMAAKRHDPQTVDGKVRIVDELLPAVVAVANPVRQAEYVRMLAERFDLREDAVRQRLRTRRGRIGSGPARSAPVGGRPTSAGGGRPAAGAGREEPEVPVASPDTARARAERWLLHLMVHVAELRLHLASRVTAEDFADPTHRMLATVLLGAASADADVLRSALNDEAAERLLLGLLFEDPPVEEKDRERVVNESVEYLVRRQRTAGRFEALRTAITAAQAAGDIQQVRRLQTEYEELIGMLHASRKGGADDGQEKGGA
jgi:DNA primase